MKRNIIINVEKHEKRIAVVENGDLEQYFSERPEQQRFVGNIYKAKVDNVVSGIQAAFVNLGMKKNGFLYVSDITKPFGDYREILEEEAEELEPTRFKENVNIKDVLQPQQEVIVQIVKDNISTKGPRLTTNISLPGRYLVLMPFQSCTGISKRIGELEERERLKNIIKGFRLPDGAGLIVRTLAEGASKRELIRDFKYLIRLMRNINNTARRVSCPSLIHQEYDLVLRVIRDYFSEDIEGLIVDSKKEYHRIYKFLHSLTPDLKIKLKLYEGGKSLFEEYKLEEQMERITKRHVQLKSGGYIIIEPTESLVAIDINTGSFVKRGSLEETAFITNKEAACEIVRQLKLRDLGGIIIIDFIDMNSRQHRQEVYRMLLTALKNDRAKTKVLPISELGVVEMTRQRVGKSLESTFSETCPHCRGKGLVKSTQTIAIEALRETKKALKSLKVPCIKVNLHPKVASYVFNKCRGELDELENRHNVRILVEADPKEDVENVRVSKA